MRFYPTVVYSLYSVHGRTKGPVELCVLGILIDIWLMLVLYIISIVVVYCINFAGPEVNRTLNHCNLKYI